MKAESVDKHAIAKACGVHVTTVTLALNNRLRVAKQTRLRIQAVARRLGYVPNHAARQLARCRFGWPGRSVERMGFVVFDGIEPLRGVYMAFLAGAEQRISALGGMLIFVRESVGSPRGRFAGFARSEIVDGLALVGNVDDKALRKAKQARRPLVVIGDHHCSTPVHQANVDFRAMGRLAVQHLLALGHRRIGFVADNTAFVYQRELLEGAQAAMTGSGLILQATAWNPESALRKGQPAASSPVDILREGHVTGIVVGEPGRAESFVNSLARRGITVPGDISIVACESSDARPIIPGMAHVDAAMEDVGVAGVELLREVAANPGCAARQVLIAPTWVEGWSARAAGKQGDDKRTVYTS